MKRLYIISALLIIVTYLFAQKPEVKVQIGHRSWVTGISMSADAKIGVTVGGLDGKGVVWDLTQGREISAFTTKEGFKCAVSFDGKYCTILGKQSCEILDLESNTWLSEHKIKYKPYDFSTFRQLLAPAKTKNWVAIGYAGKSDVVQVYDIDAKSVVKSIKAGVGDIRFVGFSRNDALLIVAGDKNEIVVFDMQSFKEISSFKIKSAITAVSTDQEFKYLAVADASKSISVIETESKKEIKKITGLEFSAVDVAIDPDLNIICAANNNSVQAWSFETGELIKTLYKETEWNITHFTGNNIQINPNAGIIFTSVFQPTIWDAHTLDKVHDLAGVSGTHWASMATSTDDVALTTVFMGMQSCYVKYWDYGNITTKPFTAKYTDQVRISNNGRYIFKTAIDNTGTGEVIDITSGKTILNVDNHDGGILLAGTSFSPDSRYLATSSAKGKVNIWDINTGKLKESFVNDNRGALGMILEYSHDGKYLFTAGMSGPIFRRDVNNFNSFVAVDNGNGQILGDVSVHPNNKVVACSYNWMKATGIFDIETKKLIKEIDPGNYRVFSQAGKYFCIYGLDGSVKVYNTENYKLQYPVLQSPVTIKDLTFSPDDKFMYVSGVYSNAVFESATGKLIAMVVSTSKNDFVIYTPDNYYYLTKEANKKVHFIKDNQVFPFEQYDLKFNRPDIVFERLGYDNEELISAFKTIHSKRMAKLGFKEADFQDNYKLPSCIIKNKKELPVVTAESKLSLDITCDDESYNIDRLYVWLNDVPVFGKDGISLRELNKKQIEKQIDIELATGKNKIQVSVLNSNGTESLKQTIVTTKQGEEAKPNLYILSIGTSKYTQDIYNLKYAAKDAKDMADNFKNSEAFGQVFTKTVLDEASTKDNIVGMKEFLNQANRNDVVMVFIAGHGVLDDNLDYYFGTHDIDFANPAAKGLEYAMIENLMDGIKALKKILIMDTCHSGELDKDNVEEVVTEVKTDNGLLVYRGFKEIKPKKKSTGFKIEEKKGLDNTELMKKFFSDLRKGTGAIVISSAGGGEFALESAEWQNGIFTLCLLEGLKSNNADANKDGNILISELRDYAISQVQIKTKGMQNPTSRMENLEFDFRVW